MERSIEKGVKTHAESAPARGLHRRRGPSSSKAPQCCFSLPPRAVQELLMRTAGLALPARSRRRRVPRSPTYQKTHTMDGSRTPTFEGQNIEEEQESDTDGSTASDVVDLKPRDQRHTARERPAKAGEDADVERRTTPTVTTRPMSQNLKPRDQRHTQPSGRRLPRGKQPQRNTGKKKSKKPEKTNTTGKKNRNKQPKTNTTSKKNKETKQPKQINEQKEQGNQQPEDEYNKQKETKKTGRPTTDATSKRQRSQAAQTKFRRQG